MAARFSDANAELIHEKRVESKKSECRSRAHDLLATHRPEPLGADVEAEMERILRSHLGGEFHFEPTAT